MIHTAKVIRDGLSICASSALVCVLVSVGCSDLPQLPVQVSKPKPVPTEPSSIHVEVKAGGPVTLTSSTAVFEIKPNGYTQASIRKGAQLLTLDEPLVGVPAESDYPVVAGKELHFSLDFDQTRVLEAVGKLGVGKRVEIASHPLGPSSVPLQCRIAVEVYDKFPDVAIGSVEYKNAGTSNLTISRIVSQRHRFSARAVNKTAEPYALWMFSGMGERELRQGAIKLPAKYTQGGEAGQDSIPLVALWTQPVGQALANLDQEKAVAIPVRVDADARVDTEVRTGEVVLRPGETYSSARTLLVVYEGDYHEALKLWANMLQAEGTRLPEATQRELVRHGVGSPPVAQELKAPVKKVPKPPKHKSSQPTGATH